MAWHLYASSAHYVYSLLLLTLCSCDVLAVYLLLFLINMSSYVLVLSIWNFYIFNLASFDGYFRVVLHSRNLCNGSECELLLLKAHYHNTNTTITELLNSSLTKSSHFQVNVILPSKVAYSSPILSLTEFSFRHFLVQTRFLRLCVFTQTDFSSKFLLNFLFSWS